MAEKPIQMLEDNRDQGYRVYLWENLTNGDTGAPLHLGGWADRSVQVVGTFGSGGTCVIQGSLMLASPTFATLDEPDSTALSWTSADIAQILEMTVWVRPNVTAGDGTTDLDVYIMVRKG